MWLIIGLVVIGIIALFVLQNTQLVTLGFFGGMMKFNLPIAVWVLLFVFAGVISSLTLQFLYNLGRTTKSRVQNPFTPSPAPEPPPRTPSRNERFFETEQRSPIEPSTSTDWRRKNEVDDWDIEVPPSQPTQTRRDYVERRSVSEPPQTSAREPIEPSLTRNREDFERHLEISEPPQTREKESVEEILQELKEENSPIFEVQRPPQSVNRTGSIYSYTYREAKKTERHNTAQTDDVQEAKKSQRNNPNQVYDADYRVITPPYNEDSGQGTQVDDDDWI